ncbi:MAG TPA: hypothetical protein VHY91_00360 [Pirellulales bacterium]|nr:hypothetical protein [Pirellulales bacterium]
MDPALLERHFARMGARLRLNDEMIPRRRTGAGVVTLDVRRDAQGEFFDIITPRETQAEVAILDVQPSERHLLVLVRENSQKHKFLCGHDERHWFVAAIPESAPVGTVRQAKEALKPVEVQRSQARVRLDAKARNRRKNAAYQRQGEWFFLPAPGLKVERKKVLRHEPLSRGVGSKPHWAEFCYRTGGETVYTCGRFPGGISQAEYKRLIDDDPGTRNLGWRTMVRGAVVYVQGRISHADHKTIMLHQWHRVLMNTENQSRAMRNVAFLD